MHQGKRTHRKTSMHDIRQHNQEMETMTDEAVNGWLIVYFGVIILSIVIFGD